MAPIAGRTKAHILLFLANLIYAINFTVAKEVMPDYIAPFGFILFRVAISLFIFYGIHRMWIRERMRRADLPLVALCAILGVATNQLLFFKGLNWSTPINASLIMTTTPILVLIAANFLIGESINARKTLGILIGAIGAIYLITSSGVTNAWHTIGLGEMLIFTNACSYGLYIVIVKKLLAKYHPFTVVFWIYLIGLPLVFPFGIREAMDVDWSTFSPAIWLAFIFVVLCATVLAFIFNAVAIKILSPTIVSIYIYSQPLMASLIALSFDKDVLTWPKVISGICICLGVFLVSYERGLAHLFSSKKRP